MASKDRAPRTHTSFAETWLDLPAPSLLPASAHRTSRRCPAHQGKPTFLFRDDLRRATDSEHYPLNLMLFTGMPEDGWGDWYYTSLEEIAAPDKALARWAASS